MIRGVPVAALALLIALPAAGGPASSPVPPVTVVKADRPWFEAAPSVAGADDPGGAGADSLDGLRITRIDVQARTIFDPVPPGRLAPLLRLANKLHVRTRDKTVREQLLVAPGDRWSEAKGRESARRLRSLDFLVPIELEGRRESDSVVVQAVTRDVWSTNPEFDIESGGGKHYGSLALRERNFLGLGKSFIIAYRDLPSGRSREIQFHDPSLQGTRIQVHYAASDGASGASDEIEIAQPFYSEDAPRTFGFRWNRTTSVATLYAGPAEVSQFNRRYDQWAVFWGAGARSGPLVRRAVATFEARGRRFGPALVASPETPPEFTGGEQSLVLRRLTVEGRLWRPHYIERVRVNGFGLVEDFDLGPALSLGIGAAPRLLGSSQDEAFASGSMALGVLTPVGFGRLTARGATRLQNRPLETLGEAEARWVQQSRFGQTLVLAARGVHGRDMARDFEVTAGGLNGLRAYPVTAVTGTRLVRLNAENRWTVGRQFWESVTVGHVVFMDAARAWGPGSGMSQWHVGAGTGLRIVLPQWSLGQVIRIDLAWPVSPSNDGSRRPVLSFGSSQAF